MKDPISNKSKFKTKEAKLILHSGIYIYFYNCQACSTTAVHAKSHLENFRGCLDEKTRTGTSFIPGYDFLILYRVYIMTGSFHISLFEGTLYVDKIHVWFKITNVTHALPIPVYWQTDFTPKQVVISRLHDTAARFCTGVKFWPPGTRTGVNSRRGHLHQHDILWW